MSQSYAQNLSPSLINSYLTSPVAFQLWVVDISDSPADFDPSSSVGSRPTWAIEQYDWIGGDWDALNSSITLNSLEIQTQTTGGGSSPMISSPKLTGTTFTLSVPTQIGFNYTLEYKNSFSDASWTAVQTIGGTGGTIIFDRHRSYRLKSALSCPSAVAVRLWLLLRKKSGLRKRRPLCVFSNLILRMRSRGRRRGRCAAVSTAGIHDDAGDLIRAVKSASLSL